MHILCPVPFWDHTLIVSKVARDILCLLDLAYWCTYEKEEEKGGAKEGEEDNFFWSKCKSENEPKPYSEYQLSQSLALGWCAGLDPN